MSFDLYSDGFRRGGYSATKFFSSTLEKGWTFDLSAGATNSCSEPRSYLYCVSIRFNYRPVFSLVVYDDVSMYQALKEFRKLVHENGYTSCEADILAMQNTLIKYAFDLLFVQPDGIEKLQCLFEELYQAGFQNGEATLQSKFRELLGT